MQKVSPNVETIEYRTADKTSWGPGPWQEEPDKIQWADEKTGLPCLIVRGPLGSLCGYVGVPEGHPWFGIRTREFMERDDKPIAHSGVNYASGCDADAPEDRGICHIPAAGEPDHVWWLGFDTSHAWDVSPALTTILADCHIFDNSTYKDVAYVRAVCAELAAQAADACS